MKNKLEKNKCYGKQEIYAEDATIFLEGSFVHALELPAAP